MKTDDHNKEGLRSMQHKRLRVSATFPNRGFF